MRSRADIEKRAKDIGFVPHVADALTPGDSFIVWPYGTDPILLTCKSTNLVCGCVYAVENANEYAMTDCVKVTC